MTLENVHTQFPFPAFHAYSPLSVFQFVYITRTDEMHEVRKRNSNLPELDEKKQAVRAYVWDDGAGPTTTNLALKLGCRGNGHLKSRAGRSAPNSPTFVAETPARIGKTNTRPPLNRWKPNKKLSRHNVINRPGCNIETWRR